MALWKHHNTTRPIQYKEMKSILGGVYWVTTAVRGDAGMFFAQGCEKMEQSRQGFSRRRGGGGIYYFTFLIIVYIKLILCSIVLYNIGCYIIFDTVLYVVIVLKTLLENTV